VATIGIAVNSKSKNAKGEMTDETLFIDCVVFGKTADNCAQFLHKGSKALIEGRLRQRRWEKDGQKFSKVEVIANGVRFLTPKGQGAGSAAAGDSDHVPDEVSDVEPF